MADRLHKPIATNTIPHRTNTVAVPDFSEAADFNDAIYAASEVKTALLEDQYSKCAFCESLVQQNQLRHRRALSPEGRIPITERRTAQTTGLLLARLRLEQLVFLLPTLQRAIQREPVPVARQSQPHAVTHARLEQGRTSAYQSRRKTHHTTSNFDNTLRCPLAVVSKAPPQLKFLD